MTKSNLTAAVAAILMVTSPLAYAQISAPPHQTATPEISAATTGAAGTEIRSDQVRASKMIGSAVYDVQNRDVGLVKDLVIDGDGQIAAVVLDVGTFLGIGGKYVAVPFSAIKSDNSRLTLNRTKDQLKLAESFNLKPNPR